MKHTALASRRAGRLALAVLEAARRCAFCRIDLAAVPGPTVTTLDGRRFCSRGCFDDSTTWEETLTAWRRAQTGAGGDLHNGE